MAVYVYPYTDQSLSGSSAAFSYITLTGFMYESVTNGITATPTGTQTTSVLLTTSINRVVTVANSGDGLLLPPSVPGLSIKVINANVSNPVSVFPASATQGGVTGGDAINALSQNSSFSVVATKSVTFTSTVLGTWNTTVGA